MPTLSGKLRDDANIRRISQVIFATIIGALNVIEIFLVMFFLGALLGKDWAQQIAAYAVPILVFPYQNLFSTVSTSVAASLPALVSDVCYNTPDQADQQQTSSLNRLGYAFIMSNIVGLLLCGAATLMMSLSTVEELKVFASGTDAASAKATVAALLSFHVLYFSQFMRLTPR